MATKENTLPRVSTSIASRVHNSDDNVVFVIADDVTLTMTCVDNKWTADFPRLQSVNLDNSVVLTKGYVSETAGEFVRTRDHAFIALGRQLCSLAEDRDSHNRASASVASIKNENESLRAISVVKDRAIAIITGLDTVALTKDELAILNDSRIASMCDAALASASAKKSA